MSNVKAIIGHNLARVRERIADSAVRSNRSPESIRLVAVTKYVSAEMARVLVDLNCYDLGESRPQELWSKANVLQNREVTWHLIGHLQRNKVARTVELATWIHAGDSPRILEALNAACVKTGVRPSVLLEVNVSGDVAKTGLSWNEVEELAPRLDQFSGVDIVGLMAMSGFDSDAKQARAEFCRVRELRDKLQSLCPAGVQLNELSMGMSDDFEEAIAEGATLVRVGSRLFSGIENRT